MKRATLALPKEIFGEGQLSGEVGEVNDNA